MHEWGTNSKKVFHIYEKKPVEDPSAKLPECPDAEEQVMHSMPPKEASIAR